jgi:hypothetical protein
VSVFDTLENDEKKKKINCHFLMSVFDTLENDENNKKIIIIKKN